MHWVFVVYAFVCLVQLPLFLFLCLGLGHHMPRPAGALVPHPELVAAGDPWVVFQHTAHAGFMDWEAAGACACAMLLACVHLHLQRAYEDDVVGCALHQSDAAIEWLHERHWLELARAAFWGAVLCQSAVWAAALGRGARTDHELWLLAMYRAAGLMGLARTSAGEDDPPPWPAHLAGAYAYVVLSWGSLAPVASWPLLALVAADALLLWAHAWERPATADVVLNARLFYLTCTGSLLLLLPYAPLPA